MSNESIFSTQIVGSRCILHSASFHSSSPSSSNPNDIAHLLDIANNLDKQFDYMSIYVCSDALNYFVTNTLPKIHKKFTLVSGDSDLCVPREALSGHKFNILINSPYLIQWYAQNTQFQGHPKIKQLPIGLDYHTIYSNPNSSWRAPKEGIMPLYQESILLRIKQLSKPFQERISNKVFVSFGIGNDRWGDRHKCLKEIDPSLMDTHMYSMYRTQLWLKMSQYAFILSPPGIGLDCHRTWEALALGCIPILRTTNFREMMDGLPVLFVNEWNEITPALLDNTINEFKNKEFNYDKLKLSYWLNKINQIK